jgi:hypothetical protein
MPIAKAKIARPICQPKLSLPMVKVKTPEKRIANTAARVEKFRTDAKTVLAPFTGLVYEPT